ncbi:heparinase [Rubellimicrobium rubrum]|uniref:Heparinase n=2 Tax=Rubellimicrobium rubrum TaxID=2585369 RepID=A0A5C4MXG9_9RHOB|nr:heparinase II/III family protein [Rubellimicrobium rubrum]TNC48805.1 heparinase [Rubellimicrobium rubrum]
MGWGARRAALGHRIQARLASRARPGGPIAWPEPRIAGDPARGRQLLRGRLRLGEELLERTDLSPWDLAFGEPEAVRLHGMAWLDDLSAVGSVQARRHAQVWVAEWIARHGRGTGPGWTPELAADRLIHWMGHAQFLLHPPGIGEESLGWATAVHARFLERRWHQAPPGRPRVAALVALVFAGLALPDRRALATKATEALAQETGRVIDSQGAIATRNPQELLEIVALLVATNQALTRADLLPDPVIGATIARAAPTLRALRHADGGLARFHGGCRGAEGQLDQVLAAAGRPSMAVLRAGVPLHMGFLRLAAGRTTVIADAAPPPRGAVSTLAHASTLAFELTSGRRPLVVAIGPGRSFGPRWRRAARATAGHSTLALDMVSSSRLGLPLPGEDGARFVEVPARVLAEAGPQTDGLRVELAHDGWRPSHGLTHARLLHLSPEGRKLQGEDLLTTLTAADAIAFDAALNASNHLGLAFAVRFHLHPDVEAELLADGSVGMTLPSGEDWVFSHESDAALILEPSVYLEEGRLRPRPTTQIVLEGRALRPATRLRWTLAKAYGTPEGLRDLKPRMDWDEEDEE